MSLLFRLLITFLPRSKRLSFHRTSPGNSLPLSIPMQFLSMPWSAAEASFLGGRDPSLRGSQALRSAGSTILPQVLHLSKVQIHSTYSAVSRRSNETSSFPTPFHLFVTKVTCAKMGHTDLRFICESSHCPVSIPGLSSFQDITWMLLSKLKALPLDRLIRMFSVYLFCILFYFWLLLITGRGLSLVAASRGYSLLWCLGFSLG